MFAKRILFLALFSVVLAHGSLLFGQANGSFSGTVSDKTGSVVSGASVKVTSQSTGFSREAKTDGSGHFTIPLLPVSNYTIRVEAPSFQPGEQKDVRLQVDEQREVDFTLSPSSVTQSVEVTGTEVAVETSNASLGQVITAQQVVGLPLNGRNFVQLATLTPGTVQETNPNSFFNGGPSSEVSARGSYSLSVGGSRAQATDWLLDDNDNNELTAGGISIIPSIDAIQEFKVLTYNYQAQYGTRAGPTVLITTKSGSNQYHGSVFEFFRNKALDSRSYFASTKEKFNLNQFGGALGGPIVKDKTFFFADYQAKMQRRGIPFVGIVPTLANRSGDYTNDPFGNPRSLDITLGAIKNPYTGTNLLCDGAGNPSPDPGGVQSAGTPCNKVPSDMIDPVGQALINLYPLPNASNATSQFNYTNVPTRKLNEGEFDVRLDHSFSSKDSMFARFSYDQATSFIPGGSPGFAEANAFASTQRITNHGRNVALSETHVFSDRNINQFNIGYNRIFNHILSFGDRSCTAAKIGILGANLDDSCPGAPGGLSQSKKDCISCGLSSVLMGGGYWALGDRGFAPFQGGTNVYSVSDSFTMIRGNHNISVGGGVRFNQMNVLTNGFQDGFFLLFGGYTNDASADLLVGQVAGAIHDQTFKGATTGRRWKIFRPYIQDEWRVTKNLTANIGVAWAFVTPITEARNRQANFNFATGKYLIAGQGSDGRVGIQFDKTAVEPRIGLAWKPFGSQITSVRAGYGIFHDSSWNQGAQGTWQNPPYYAETDNFNFGPVQFGQTPCPFQNASQLTPLDCGLARGFLPGFLVPPDPASFTGTIQSQNLNFKQGVVQQYNLNLEHQLPGQVVLTMGYAGAHSTHILVDGQNLNIASPTACGVVTGYTLGCGIASAPYGPFTTVANINDIGRAIYNSLQVKAETKSARHGLYGLVSYTFARNMDSGFSDGVGTSLGATYYPLPGTKHADWALSQVNLKHNFSASIIYDLPFGKGKQFGNNWSGATNAVLGGWEVDVIQKLTSGFPIFVFNSTDQSGVAFNNGGNNFNRPDQTCDPKSGGQNIAHWINTACFAAAPLGQLGNSSRSPLYGPNFVNTDFSAIKHFVLPFREGMGLDFRAEFFNLFNHSQFGLPSSDIAVGRDPSNPGVVPRNSPTFGVINSTVNNPRLIQFALKLNF